MTETDALACVSHAGHIHVKYTTLGVRATICLMTAGICTCSPNEAMLGIRASNKQPAFRCATDQYSDQWVAVGGYTS